MQYIPGQGISFDPQEPIQYAIGHYIGEEDAGAFTITHGPAFTEHEMLNTFGKEGEYIFRYTQNGEKAALWWWRLDRWISMA